jgi:hypothetical protein
MTDTQIVNLPERQSLERYLPQSVKDLAWMANEVAKSGIYKNGRNPMTGSEVFVVMMKGGELGLTPMQSMNEISLIKGKPFVSKDVLTARITRSPRCTHWDPSDCDEKHARIVFGVRGDTLPTRELETKLDDIPQRYFKDSASGEPSNWTLIPEDMLYAWVVRRIARRWFPEALLDIGDGQPEPIDESKVIDIAKVERAVGASEFGPCAECRKGTVYLHAGRNGGAYLRCDSCSATFQPPQEVRDAVRGTPEHLTLAGTAETVLEPGEHELTPDELAQLNEGIVPPAGVIAQLREEFPLASRMVPEHVDANDSAVQSESERDTIDGEDVVAVPASVVAVAAEAPIPVPAAPASNQAMRDAVYQHWIKPRPTANKIEMRGLLDEHGWHGDQSLGDWMLTLTDDQLAKIGDAIKDIP